MLEGAPAFHALVDALSGVTGGAPLRDPAQERLRLALVDPAATALDLAVLVRHVLLAETMRRGETGAPTLPKHARLTPEAIATAGLFLAPDGRLRALPWRPDWLETVAPGLEPDLVAAGAKQRRFGDGDTGPEGDPFLTRVGHGNYRSVGQRAAVRAALLTPAAGTTAIDLPTGEGKSLIFRAIDAVGFSSDLGDDRETGVTVVVVPTIALGYDHERACRKPGDPPLAYVGPNVPERHGIILERLNGPGVGLVFAAPEAVCLSLREPLKRLARAGRLKALVIDEAHLVDAWGTGFRTPFQTLGGFRDELVAIAPSGQAPRTILLSATLTPETLETLRTLFATDGDLRVLSANQVRPEPDYWVANPTDEPNQVDRACEALARIPRPAILYVTKVTVAEAWGLRLLALGYGRVAVFHGQQTDDAKKQAVLRSWSAGNLDLVVATSAFGLGIDYQHVRSILHACVPETFDRFYQEVGRGGRDGRAALSLTIPAHKDFRTAKGLNRTLVISVVLGLQRWSSMFKHTDSQHLSGNKFRLRLDVSPGLAVDRIDVVGERSVQWNARTLTLMARAGLLRLTGGDTNPGTDAPEGVYETVELLDPGHLDEDVWQRRVEPIRAAIAGARQRNLQLMIRHLEDKNCPSNLVIELYRSSNVDMACSACRRCRADPAQRHGRALRREPASPWPTPPLPLTLSALLARDQRLVVTYDPNASGPAQQRRAGLALDGMWRSGLRNLVLLGNPPELFARALARLIDWPIFVARDVAIPRLPPGPQVVLIGTDHMWKRPGGLAGGARVLLLPVDAVDPDRPGERLLDRWSGPIINLDELTRRMAT
jgi:hypothetical protein